MKEKRKQKQEMKIKQKFSFLTDIIAENEKNTDEKIQALYECVEKNKSEIIQKLLTVNESIQVLDNNVKKLQSDIGESKTIAEENIEKLKNCLMENGSNVKETIRSVIAKVEQIDKAGFEREKQLEDVLLTKSEMITSRIEDVKSLVQLLAVNESIQVLDNNVKKLQSDIEERKTIEQENSEELKNRLMEYSGDIKETIRSVIAKVEQIDKDGFEREKHLEDVLLTKSEMITSEIECAKSLIQLLTVNEGDIKETIRSVIAKIEQIDKAGLERGKQFEDVLLTKSEIITSEIEDVKSLVQLLAINELVDEIDISAT
jgi:hypothetical protein